MRLKFEKKLIIILVLFICEIYGDHEYRFINHMGFPVRVEIPTNTGGNQKDTRGDSHRGDSLITTTFPGGVNGTINSTPTLSPLINDNSMAKTNMLPNWGGFARFNVLDKDGNLLAKFGPESDMMQPVSSEITAGNSVTFEISAERGSLNFYFYPGQPKTSANPQGIGLYILNGPDNSDHLTRVCKVYNTNFDENADTSAGGNEANAVGCYRALQAAGKGRCTCDESANRFKSCSHSFDVTDSYSEKNAPEAVTCPNVIDVPGEWD